MHIFVWIFLFKFAAAIPIVWSRCLLLLLESVPCALHNKATAGDDDDDDDKDWLIDRTQKTQTSVQKIFYRSSNLFDDDVWHSALQNNHDDEQGFDSDHHCNVDDDDNDVDYD